jgi:outer membrane lipoprotein
MTRLWCSLIAMMLLITFGCASTDDQLETSSSGTPQITFTQVKATPESYKGQPVTFGGKVLGARRLKEGTRIEILQLPLTSSLQPALDLRKSQGRFVAMQQEFLDPATIPAGTFVTITGEVAGSVTMPLDEMKYTYPIVDIKNLRVWTKDEEESSRLHSHIGPGPYWGPYWSPYWRHGYW